MTLDPNYRDVLGSDVMNDGMYLELRNSDDEVVACVFRSEIGSFEVHLGPRTATTSVIDNFIERAKTFLDARAHSS